MTKINKTVDKENTGKVPNVGRNTNLYNSENQYGKPSKKLTINLPYDPAISLLVIHPKDSDTCSTMPIAIIFTIAGLWKQSLCPSTDK